MNTSMIKSLIGITPASIEKYLLLTGWSRDISYGNPKLMFFQNKKDDNLRIAAPSSDTVFDYYERIYDLISFLSAFSDCPEADIINSLKSAYIDRIQFRIISDSTKSGMISLEYASQCIEGLKELVLYSACAEEKARPICVRTFSSAKKQLEKFQFEQTEVGSFVFNVGVRVADEENEQLYLQEVDPSIKIPVEHKIVKRIERAFWQIHDVTSRAIQLSDLVTNAYEDGITANMCDALSMLRPEDKEFELETSFHYAEALTKSVVPPLVSRFDWMHFDVANEISKIYKDCTIIEDATLVGVINMLSKSSKAAASEDDQMDNTVRLVTRIDDRMRSVDLHLSSKNHTLACDAYRDDKEVEVTGTIDKSGKRWFFSDVSSFKVLN